MQRLNHVISNAKDVKSQTTAALSKVYKNLQKATLFGGHTRRWKADADEGPVYQSEDKKVQLRVEDVIEEARKQWSLVMDIEATRDFANMNACADVRVGAVVILKDAPVPFLLSLEKQLKDLAAFVEKLPELDPAEFWDLDAEARFFRGRPKETYKTRKVSEAQVVVAPTEQHPGQWTELARDIREGTWTTTSLSGATTSSRKKELLERVNTLRQAVHVARENANLTEAPSVEAGAPIFNYVFGE